MTKRREPLTPERAITRIADLIGWDRMAELAGKAPRTIGEWSQPDTSSGIPFAIAARFDIEFQRQGGDHSPMHEALGHLIVSALAEEFAEQFELQDATCDSIRETAQAHAAVLIATRYDAPLSARPEALREVEEGIHSLTRIASGLKRLMRGTRAPAVAEQQPP